MLTHGSRRPRGWFAQGAEIIFYPTARQYRGRRSPRGFGVRRGSASAAAIATASTSPPSTVGRRGYRFFGGSFVADAFGNVLAPAGDLGILVVEIDLR